MTVADPPQQPVVQQPSPQPQVIMMAGGAGTAPPGDAPAGGNWVQDQYCGCKSWLCCVGLILVGGVPGLFVPCCPCDTRLVYVVSGHKFTKTGSQACFFGCCC
ncbi:unnamed protein product [Ectocarpus sp. 4 AP-2014]